MGSSRINAASPRDNKVKESFPERAQPSRNLLLDGDVGNPGLPTSLPRSYIFGTIGSTSGSSPPTW
jgi:hypothetical protein